ncbi:MAG: SDR family oxidoreductase [Propioniciclava sp.]|uniref:SDR family NAD(P)-dependent oxidoreductase n=1 Tax=Propioniciclava sp. TaxID=2038686 RepID=UPI0039E3B22B
MTRSERPVALITGASRGIGACLARRLAAQGWNLVLTYRDDADAAARVVAECEVLGVRVVTVQADLRGASDEAIAAPFEMARGRFGRIDAFVNNASITTRYAPVADTPVDEIRETIDVDFTAVVLGARRAVREFVADGTRGVIVNVSSGAATLGSPGEYAHYAAAKAGVDAFTMGLGKEVGPLGIRVVAVAPGLVDTELHAATGDPERVERMAQDIPLRRAADPEEIAGVIAWLLGPEASYITATTIRVAGGR